MIIYILNKFVKKKIFKVKKEKVKRTKNMF